MDDKKTALRDALKEYKEIKNAANAMALKKLSDEFPEKFNEYLSEHLNKNKNKKNEEESLDSKENKESEKLDEGLENKKDKKDMKKEENKEKETQKGVEEKIVENKEKDNKEKTLNENLSDDEYETDDLLDDYGIKDVDSYGLEDIPEEEFDLSDIEEEISKMEELEEELQEVRDTSWSHDKSVTYGPDSGVAFKEKLKGLKNMLNELLDEGEEDLGESKEGYIDETEDDVITDADLEGILDEMNHEMEFEDEIDEHHGKSHGFGRKQTAKLPGEGSDYRKNQMRYAMRENEKITKNLIETNKKTTKSLNEQRKKVKVLSELVEGYKAALEKYRDQLMSMSVFNTNLAHVNNILVNEELSLTPNEKIKIIKEFKEINSIAESEKKYKNILSEMKKPNKKTLDEGLDEKLSKSSIVDGSSKKALDEVIEKTAYENNDHIQKIKRLSEYIENRRK